MGTSTDAKLWWGLCDTSSEDGLPEVVQEKLRPMLPDMEEEYELAEHAEKLIEPFGCKLVYHCSDSCTMYGIAIKESEVTAWRGHPRAISSIDIGEDWTRRVMAAAEAIGWHVGEVQWWIASWWG